MPADTAQRLPMNRPAVARILDPQTVPVVGVDDHLPALPVDRLTAQALRRHFSQGPLAEPEWPGDGARFDALLAATPAAVLVPLVVRPQGLQVLLTRRTEHLRVHAGQISFPGGRSEPEDADAVATALRETAEEVGIAGHQIEVIGRLPHYQTVTSFVVTPVVGLLQPDYTLALDPFEVAEVFEVPLQFLMTPGNHRRHAFEFEGQQRQFLSMPWRLAATEYFIWGATAAMLRNLYSSLARTG